MTWGNPARGLLNLKPVASFLSHGHGDMALAFRYSEDDSCGVHFWPLCLKALPEADWFLKHETWNWHVPVAGLVGDSILASTCSHEFSEVPRLAPTRRRPQESSTRTWYLDFKPRGCKFIKRWPSATLSSQLTNSSMWYRWGPLFVFSIFF